MIADAKALAELLGTSATGAIREAVRERLERERAERKRQHDAEGERFVQELLEIGRCVRARLPPGVTSDHSDLYDENGLPM